MLKNKIPFEDLPIEEQFDKVFRNYERIIQERVLYDVMMEFYFADWTRKCNYDKMTSEEVVEAAMAACKRIEEKYNYSLDDDIFDSIDRDWSDCYDDI